MPENQKPLPTWTLAELEAENIRLSAEKDRIRARQRELTAAIDQKMADADADRRLAEMSEPQKRALHQRMEAQGIGTSEQLGAPGTGGPR